MTIEASRIDRFERGPVEKTLLGGVSLILVQAP